METLQSLIDDIENVMESGSFEKRADILRMLIELFLVSAEECSDHQFDVCVDFFSHCAEWVDVETRAEFANRLAPAANAPTAIVRAFARDPAFEVAEPVLMQSTQLSDKDLLDCVDGKAREWLLAISKRASLSKTIGDMLATQGDQEIVRSVAQNAGARFSDFGFGKLVEKSKDDEQLAVTVASRQDVPQKFFSSLSCDVSEAVFKKLIRAVVRAREAEKKRDYAPVRTLYDSVVGAGPDIEPVLYDFARSGEFDQTVVALSLLCQLPLEVVGNIIEDKRVRNDLILILAKRAGLPWCTAKVILHLRYGDPGLSPEELEAACRTYENLHPATVRRVLQLYRARHGAKTAPAGDAGRDNQIAATPLAVEPDAGAAKAPSSEPA